MIRTYKRKLILTKVQEKRLLSWIGACRVVYNLGLEIKIDTWNKKRLSIHKYDLNKQLPPLRKEVEWIRDVPSGSLQNAIERLDEAYKSFFNGKGFPKWASKRDYSSITFTENIGVYGNFIIIPKIRKIKIFKDEQVLGDIKRITIKKEISGFYASIMCGNVPGRFISENNSIGVDMGLAHFAILSDENIIGNPKHFKKHERKLRIENRSLARKKKFSKSWYRQAKKLSLLHHKIGNIRKDFLHKQSTLIAKANNVVYMENLNVKGMAKNTNLSKHILDAGWYAFRTMLSYKTSVVPINPAYTSQTCFECKVVDKLSRVSQSSFICISCGHSANADINAAKNIKHQGMMLQRQREALACA